MFTDSEGAQVRFNNEIGVIEQFVINIIIEGFSDLRLDELFEFICQGFFSGAQLSVEIAEDQANI